MHCCRTENGPVPAPTPRRAAVSRAGEAAAWAGPAALLALMPKCPVCVAGYVALVSGIGISASAAAWLRTVLIVVCAAALLFLAARRLRRLSAWIMKLRSPARP